MLRNNAIFVIAIGAMMLALVIAKAIPFVRVLRYRAVSGTVLSAKIDSTIAGRINLHRPVIEYSYPVDGVRYENNVFDPLGDDGTKKWAKGILDRYPIGAACTVYYDPSRPQTSVLSTSPNGKTKTIAIALLLLGVVLVSGGIVANRRARKSTSETRR